MLPSQDPHASHMLQGVQQDPQPAGELLTEALKTAAAKDALKEAPPGSPARRLQVELEHNRCVPVCLCACMPQTFQYTLPVLSLSFFHLTRHTFTNIATHTPWPPAPNLQ